jgi:hypothetical protein
VTLSVAEQSIQNGVLRIYGRTMLYDKCFPPSARACAARTATPRWPVQRKIYAGLDPPRDVFVSVRVIAHASEDVGMANPNAMVQRQRWQA